MLIGQEQVGGIDRTKAGDSVIAGCAGISRKVGRGVDKAVGARGDVVENGVCWVCGIILGVGELIEDGVCVALRLPSRLCSIKAIMAAKAGEAQEVPPKAYMP